MDSVGTNITAEEFEHANHAGGSYNPVKLSEEKLTASTKALLKFVVSIFGDSHDDGDDDLLNLKDDGNSIENGLVKNNNIDDMMPSLMKFVRGGLVCCKDGTRF
jgi:hypothetical protein